MTCDKTYLPDLEKSGLTFSLNHHCVALYSG